MWGHQMVQSKRFWNVVGEVDGGTEKTYLVLCHQREERERERESNCLED